MYTILILMSSINSLVHIHVHVDILVLHVLECAAMDMCGFILFSHV